MYVCVAVGHVLKTLLQRSLESAPWVRRVDAVSPRSPPAVPNLPGGPAHKLADNYYYARDVRRAVTQPTIASTHQLLTGTLDEVTGSVQKFCSRTIGPPDHRYIGVVIFNEIVMWLGFEYAHGCGTQQRDPAVCMGVALVTLAAVCPCMGVALMILLCARAWVWHS